MSWKKVFAVIRREYTERVRTKGFWIATLLIPALTLVYIVIQVGIARKSGGERHLAVVDTTGRLYQPLVKEVAEQEALRKKESPSSRVAHWVLQPRAVQGSLEQTKEALRQEVLDEKINGYLVLSPELLDKNEVEYYSTTVSEFAAMNMLERAMSRIRMREKVVARGLPADLASELEKRVDLKPFKVTKSGATEEKGAGIIAALIFFLLMYATFFMYGAQVMRGVLEEKNNRIVEVVIASVRPTELMVGKMIGIGLVGLTQYAVWAVVAMNLSLPGIAGALATSSIGAPRIPISMLGYFVLFFILGYFLYASVYMTIARSLQHRPGGPAAGDGADGAHHRRRRRLSGGHEQSLGRHRRLLLALPVHRLAHDVPEDRRRRSRRAGRSCFRSPSWSLSTAGISWLAGRIYRVGILMYGKKPTIPEIARWVRYKPGQAPQPALPQAK